MPPTRISFRETGFFSPLICDYLDDHPGLRESHNGPVSLEALGKQLEVKQKSFTAAHRQLLARVLKEQYGTIASAEVEANIALLVKENTFTITTGHQLSLCTGPLYFIYKIVSTIALCQQLKAKYPNKHFVPVYWMATEDHDFEEISSFRFEDKKIKWSSPAVGGPVGRMRLESLQPVLDHYEAFLGNSQAADQIREWLKNSYRSSVTLAEATRKLVHQLFAEEGLVVIDADHRELKQLFVPVMKKEFHDQLSYHSVLQTILNIKEDYSAAYSPQVNPREVNLFYFDASGRRDRLMPTPDGFQTVEGKIQFSLEEIMTELQQFPERFSPNVLLRPVYQEFILPNLCYIGGGGELAYWLQLKDYFKKVAVPFPYLLLRNSAILVPAKTERKLEKLHLQPTDLFLNRTSLINKKIRAVSNIDLDLSPFKVILEKQFAQLHELVQETDASFLGTVRAQEKKQFKGIDALEKRLLQAQKKKLVDHVERLSRVHEQLFPQQSLQERHQNFFSFYLREGAPLLHTLKAQLDPLDQSFLWITLPDS